MLSLENFKKNKKRRAWKKPSQDNRKKHKNKILKGLRGKRYTKQYSTKLMMYPS